MKIPLNDVELQLFKNINNACRSQFIITKCENHAPLELYFKDETFSDIKIPWKDICKQIIDIIEFYTNSIKKESNCYDLDNILDISGIVLDCRDKIHRIISRKIPTIF